MPYKIRKVRGKDCYKTYNTVTKRVFAVCTTKEKALRQLATIRRNVYGTSKSPINKKMTKRRQMHTKHTL